MEYNEVKKADGERNWNTGSKRGANIDKGRYDLIPEYALYRVARVYQNGAAVYDEENWRKGQNLRTYLDSAIRHIFNYKAGFRDEDHLASSIFNLLAIIETEKMIEDGFLPKELNDLRVQPYKREPKHNLIGVDASFKPTQINFEAMKKYESDVQSNGLSDV